MGGELEDVDITSKYKEGKEVGNMEVEPDWRSIKHSIV